MKLYEFITPSDPITFYAADNDIAEAVGLVIGNGNAGIDAVDGSDTPNTMYLFGSLPDDVLARFRESLEKRADDMTVACKTFAVCESGMREEYDELTKNSTDIERVKKWDDKHRSSMSKWCEYAWSLSFKKKSAKSAD